MTLTKTLLLFSAIGLSGVTSARHYTDDAKVVHVEPVYDYLRIQQPEQVCYPLERRHSRYNPTSTIVGAVIGGAIGNALARNSRSRGIATVAGATIGSQIGYHSGRRRDDTSYSQHCETHYASSTKVRELRGYDVTYRYRGQSMHTFMKHYPGKRIKVKVRAKPSCDD